MKTSFHQLRQNFREVPSKQGRAVGALHSWLRENAAAVAATKPDAEFNGTMLQGFHWYLPTDGSHWKHLAELAPSLAAAHFTGIWFPPASKAMGGMNDVGYGIYDLFDLGEFVQGANPKPDGERRTKYGSRKEYIAAVESCHKQGIEVYADVVFNHKMGGEFEEEFEAIPFDPANRNRALEDRNLIKSYTGFDFPNRNGEYSTMKWRWQHFGSVDYNSLRPDFKAIWRKADKGFCDEVDLENGNYDFLMGCDLDVDHPEVSGELKYWGRWMLDTAPISGFRLDAIKHIEGDFFNDWMDELEAKAGRDLFCVGEYWTPRIDTLTWYIGNTGGRLNLFDSPLQDHFHQASQSGGNYNMGRILDGTLMKESPMHAVTLVENHDTQPLQSLEAVVEPWFKPLAYAIILLRAEGYPCVFWADYFGAEYTGKGRDGNDYHIVLARHKGIIDLLMLARWHFAHGAQYSYLDHFNTIGWTRLGTEQHPHAMAVILSDGPEGTKWMEAGKRDTDFVDITGHIQGKIRSNGDGWAEFRCNGGDVSVWVEDHAELAGLLAELPKD